jgi:peptidoglycan hydrolase-like protein with peptidoglycan-binding domain
MERVNEREAIRNLQRYLRQLSFVNPEIPTPPIDGIYGTEMVSVTRAFQSDHGLPADGKAGKLTLTKVKELMEDDEPDEDTEVDFDELVDPWDEMTLEEKVEDLHQWRLSMMRGGESNG